MLGLKVPTESRRKSLSSFLLVPPTSHLSTLHANSEEARELGKHSQQGCRGGICRSDEKCVKPLADRIPASIPLVPHCSPSSQHSWSWLRPSPPPPGLPPGSQKSYRVQIYSKIPIKCQYKIPSFWQITDINTDTKEGES